MKSNFVLEVAINHFDNIKKAKEIINKRLKS
jgi:hypothetical protein